MAYAESISQSEQLEVRLQELMSKAESLCEKCSSKHNIIGTSKLRKKCQAELKFLRRIGKKGTLKESHLASSNLTHLEGIVHAMESLPNVTAVLQPFQYAGLCHPLCVDIVCNHGFTWVKVIARKAQALHLVWAGEGQFGEKNIVDQASQFVECANEWPVNFTAPSVVMIFLNGITLPLKEELGNLGVHVQGAVQEVQKCVIEQLSFDTTSLSDNGEQESFNFLDIEDIDNMSDEDSDMLLSASEYWSRNTAKNCNGTPENQAKESFITTSSGICSSSSPTKGTPVIMKDAKVEQTCDKIFVQHLPNVIKHAPNETGAITIGTHQAEQLTEQSSSSAGDVNLMEISNNQLLSSDMYKVTSDVFAIKHDIQKVNLDITTLICLVCNLCHGHCHYKFQEEILTQQACEERKEPLLPALESFLKGKELYACETALADFQSILDTVGGPAEKERAEILLQKLHIVPDDTSKRAMLLKTSAKIKERAKIIFGTGDTLQAVTVSANSGFVRAAVNQGVTFAVFLHGSRALTEQKQATATRVAEL